MRPAWQPRTQSSNDKQDTYAYPQTAAAPSYGQSYPPPPGQPYGQPGPGYPEPGYTARDAGYAAQDPGYTAQDAGYPAPDTGFAGQDQGYPGPQGQSVPQWQASPGMSASAAKSKAAGHAKGFIGSLFDFSFTSFVTPKIIKVLYVLITVWTVIWALIFLRFGFKYGGAAGGFFTLIIVDPILLLLTLGVYRVVLEFFMVVHRMHEDLKAVRERGDSQL